jgi:hypothetical protein
MEDRTACIKRTRGMLAAFSLVFGKSTKVLRAALPDALEDASNGLDGRAQRVLNRQFDLFGDSLRIMEEFAVSATSMKFRQPDVRNSLLRFEF